MPDTPPPAKPATPTNVRVAIGGQAGDPKATVILSWTPGADAVATQYKIRRGSGAASPADPAIALVQAVATPSYADTGLDPGTYSYTVAAVNGTAESDPSTPPSTVVLS